MLLIAVPYQPVLAGMVGTETVLETARGQEARDCVTSFLAREDVQTVLVAQGISFLEAEARVNSLSDGEVVRLAEQIKQLPAGASGGVDVVTIVIVAAFVVCITLFVIGVIEALW